jgi:NAD(P) transhydrogenase subunit beta
MTALNQASYLLASVLFILTLSGLSQQASARRGNMLGILGMAVAIAATVGQSDNLLVVLPAMLAGGAIGLVLAARVAMTSMPQLVAGMHSFVGLAAVLVGFARVGHGGAGLEGVIESVECVLGVAIGAITFSGSIVAFAKLQELVGSKPLIYPGRHVVTGGLLLATVLIGAWYVVSGTTLPLALSAATAAILGVLLVMAIGGADMPVVVSMLNSYSGWAAAATGFLLGNDLLIVTGALVGSSGAILSYIMCRAMNRSIWSVILGGFGAEAGPAGEEKLAMARRGVRQGGVEDAVEMMKSSRNVVVVPGYGMAVAQAQHAVREMQELLQKGGVTVRYAIHPVAGRLPGHMNVLLAEANVPYPIVLEMDDINHDLPETDVVLVLGANDIVNPDALEDPRSPIAGMPVLEVWKAGLVVAVKRSMSAGFSGVDNPLYYRDNTMMVFGDARKVVEGMVAALKGGH